MKRRAGKMFSKKNLIQIIARITRQHFDTKGVSIIVFGGWHEID
jgi:hypothetical protein